jgi:hypothetical protein
MGMFDARSAEKSAGSMGRPGDIPDDISLEERTFHG